MSLRQHEAPSPMDVNQTDKINARERVVKPATEQADEIQNRSEKKSRRQVSDNAKSAAESNYKAWKSERDAKKAERKEVRKETRSKLGAAAMRGYSYLKNTTLSILSSSKEKFSSAKTYVNRKLGDVALARAGMLAMPDPAVPKEKQRSLDDEQPSHPNAASLGDGNNKSDTPLEPANAAEVTDTPEQADVAQESNALPKTDRERSPTVEALFDPYVPALKKDGSLNVFEGHILHEGMDEEYDDGIVKSAVKEPDTYIRFIDTSYLERDEDDETQPSALQELTRTRAAFAGVNADTRKGTFFKRSNKKISAYESAKEAYEEARLTYFNEVFDEYKDDLYPDEQNELIIAFNEREQGALAGEEAHHYLNSLRASRMQKLTDAYNDLGRGTKIAVGIGAGALMGVGIATSGLAAASAGAAVAAGYGARLARNTFTATANRANKLDGEAKALADQDLALDAEAFAQKYGLDESFKDKKRNRRKVMKRTGRDARTLSREMDAATFAGDREASKDLQTYYNGSRHDSSVRGSVNAKELFDDSISVHSDIVEARRKAESTAKRRAGALAVGSTIIGGAAGYGIGHLVSPHVNLDDIGRFVQEHNPFVSDSSANSNTPAQPKGFGAIDEPTKPTPEGFKAIDEPGGSQGPEKTPAGAPQLFATPESSAEAKSLYGNFAGNTLQVEVPAGGTVWESLRSVVLDQNKGMSFEEADRITGNMVKTIEESYARKGLAVDFTRVQPGDTVDLRF